LPEPSDELALDDDASPDFDVSAGFDAPESLDDDSDDPESLFDDFEAEAVAFRLSVL
jgi:hypothetical protein